MKIKLITLNLYEGGLLADSIIRFLQQEKPDIAVFQEVYDGKDQSLAKNFQSTLWLKQLFPDYSYHFAPELNEIFPFGEVELGNFVISKFPIRHSKVTFYDVPYQPHYIEAEMNGKFEFYPTNLQWCEVDAGEKKLNILNTHGIWGLDGEDNSRRLKMSRTIIDRIKGKENVILAGDFNLKPNTQTIAKIEKYLTNVFKDELVSTFNMKHKTNPGYATAVVDMVFLTPHMRIVSKNCPNVDVSDHLPLVVELEF